MKARYNQKSPKEILEELSKNSELKHRHGYDVASASGLVGIETRI